MAVTPEEHDTTDEASATSGYLLQMGLKLTTVCSYLEKRKTTNKIKLQFIFKKY